MAAFHLNKLVVVGVGLIGGSVAAALKRAGCVNRVVGVGRGAANLEQARDLGLIDETAADPDQAARDADMVLIAVPVRQTRSVLERLEAAARRGVPITDAGSTKRDFIADVRSVFKDRAPSVVPAHPIAGAEQTGAAAANASLFEGKRVVITPLPENDPSALGKVEEMWRACGARVTRMTAEHHDAVFSAVSHLPHVLAYALVHMIASRGNAQELFSFAAGGFRDFTRIAGSSPEMWRDICLANRDAIGADLEAFQAVLSDVAARLRSGDGDAIAKLFDTAREARRAWLK